MTACAREASAAIERVPLADLELGPGGVQLKVGRSLPLAPVKKLTRTQAKNAAKRKRKAERQGKA